MQFFIFDEQYSQVRGSIFDDVSSPRHTKVHGLVLQQERQMEVSIH